MATGRSIHHLRTLGIIEGVSFLVLLFIAMPLKYAAGIPEAVKVVGWIHGVLFMTLLTVLGWVFFRHRWPVLRAALVLCAALIPFGPFLIDRHLRSHLPQRPAPEEPP